MKKGAIFDMDGLLFDTETVFDQVWCDMAKQYGGVLDAAFFDDTRGTSGEGMLPIIKNYFPGEDPAKLIERLYRQTAERLEHNVPVKEGVWELLRYFRDQGVPMAIASSSPRAMILHHLELTGVDRYMDAVISGEDVQEGKPSPEIFLRAAESIGVAPEACYVFEDGFHGVHGGLAAGCTTVLIPDKLAPTPEIQALPVLIFDSLLHVRQAIEKGEL